MHIGLFRVAPRVQRFYKNLSAIREALVKKLVSGWPYPALRRKSPRASSKTSSVPPRSKGGKFTRNDIDLLTKHVFGKHDSMSAAELVERLYSNATASERGAEVLGFTRYEVGEGIEVEKVDFASEVAAQLGN